MKKAGLLLVTFIGFFLLGGCFFNDNAFYEVDPLPDDPPELSVVTSLDTLESPRVNDSLKVSYELSILNGTFYFMVSLVDEATVHASDSSSGSFWIYPTQSQTEGIDTLYMNFYHSSNTNTLADLAGYEASITSLKFAMDFNQEVP